eukprot:GILI01003993.1.p1 GENE.GILI01003993.1~~GILI01003993.1.p1  ORF type:complete len:399 (+),score=140.95 GILI01003993.1:160-1356(+)
MSALKAVLLCLLMSAATSLAYSTFSSASSSSSPSGIARITVSHNSEQAFQSFLEVSTEEVDPSIGNGALFSQNIKGTMRINGQDYVSVCSCDAPPAAATEAPACEPSKLKIHQDRAGQGMGIMDVRNLIGRPAELQHVNVDEQYFSCMDGRANKPVFATPGGDLGEFVLALSVYEDLLGGNRKLDQAAVDTYFTEYLKFIKRPVFYMCTDDSAVDHLEREIEIEGLDIRTPPARVLKQVERAVAEPDNVGCMHLKMLLKYPELYAIRQPITEMALRAFYKVLWDKAHPYQQKLKLEIFPKGHNETAFVEIRSSPTCLQQKMSPLVTPKKEGVSVFVNHIDAASIRRRELADFFANTVAHSRIDMNMMHNRLNHHGYAFLETTGAYVAKSLPFYTVTLV